MNKLKLPLLLLALLLGAGGLWAVLRNQAAQAPAAETGGLYGRSNLSASPFGSPAPASSKPRTAAPMADTQLTPRPAPAPPPSPGSGEQTSQPKPPQPLYAFA